MLSSYNPVFSEMNAAIFSSRFHNVISNGRSAGRCSCRTMNRNRAMGYCGDYIFRNQGSVLDVAVDIRKGSPTFGKYVSVELTEENKRQFFIPRGFAHGFAVLSTEAVFQYKCDNFYAPESEGALAWDDPDLAIDWRLPASKVILSEKDKHHPRLKEAEWLFDYNTGLYE